MRYAFALLALGCGSASTVPHEDAGGGGPIDLATAAPVDLAMASDLATAYPPGPYGNSVGDTFPLLSWIGYLDPKTDAVATSKPYAAWGSDALRRSGAPYALIHISEFY